MVYRRSRANIQASNDANPSPNEENRAEPNQRPRLAAPLHLARLPRNPGHPPGAPPTPQHPARLISFADGLPSSRRPTFKPKTTPTHPRKTAIKK